MSRTTRTDPLAIKYRNLESAYRRTHDQLVALTAAYDLDTNNTHPTHELLMDIAAALREAHELGTPAAASTPTDQDGGTRQPGSRPPNGGHPAHRRAARHLTTSLRRAVQEYHAAIKRTDPDEPDNLRGRPPTGTDPTPDKLPPSVRCQNRQCTRYDRRVPWQQLDHDDNGIPRLTILWACTQCGRPYPNHPATQQQPPTHHAGAQ